MASPQPTQIRAVAEGSTMGQASTESTNCPRCQATLDHHTDGNGRAFDKCRTCGYYSDPRSEKNGIRLVMPLAPVKPILRVGQSVPWTADQPMGIEEIPALPVIQPGQLRCQRCAGGVHPSVRFCKPCEKLNRREGQLRRYTTLPPKPPAPPKPVVPGKEPKARRPRVFAEKECRECHEKFTPTGSRAYYCLKCTPWSNVRARARQRGEVDG